MSTGGGSSSVIMRAEEVRLLLAGKAVAQLYGIGPGTTTFGSAPRLFWQHANFSTAWVDGHPSEGRTIFAASGGQYLHVPCHRGDATELQRLDRRWKAKGQAHGYHKSYPDCGPCAVCDRWGWRMTSHRLYCRWTPGDVCRVRETFCIESCYEVGWYEPPHNDGRPLNVHDEDGRWWEQAHYRATDPEPELVVDGVDGPGCRWSSPAVMPRWASRLKATVTGVRCKRSESPSGWSWWVLWAPTAGIP